MTREEWFRIKAVAGDALALPTAVRGEALRPLHMPWWSRPDARIPVNTTARSNGSRRRVRSTTSSRCTSASRRTWMRCDPIRATWPSSRGAAQ